MSEHTKAAVDLAAAGVAVGTMLQWLPAIAAAFTIVWTFTRIWEAVYGKPFSESKLARAIRGGK